MLSLPFLDISVNRTDVNNTLYPNSAKVLLGNLTINPFGQPELLLLILYNIQSIYYHSCSQNLSQLYQKHPQISAWECHQIAISYYLFLYHRTTYISGCVWIAVRIHRFRCNINLTVHLCHNPMENVIKSIPPLSAASSFTRAEDFPPIDSNHL